MQRQHDVLRGDLSGGDGHRPHHGAVPDGAHPQTRLPRAHASEHVAAVGVGLGDQRGPDHGDAGAPEGLPAFLIGHAAGDRPQLRARRGRSGEERRREEPHPDQSRTKSGNVHRSNPPPRERMNQIDY